MGDEAIISVMAADPTLLALVGGRIQTDMIGEDEPRPAIFVTQVSGEEITHLTGRSGLVHPRYQVECQGNTRKESRTVSDRVLALLNPYRGTTPSGVKIQVCRCVDRRYLVDETGLGNDRRYFTVQLDFSVWYEGL